MKKEKEGPIMMNLMDSVLKLNTIQTALTM
jgi:hypothetical protein